MNPLADALVAPLEHRKDAVLIRADGSEVTGAELFALSGQIANVLVQSGVEPGHRVAMQTEKSVEALALYLACLRAGALFLPLNTAYKTAELDYFLTDAAPTVVVCDPASEDELSALTTPNGITLLSLDATGEGSLKDEAARVKDDFAAAPRTPDDLAAILYTSGTTGRSKGAMLTQDNLLSNTQSLIEAWQFTDQDTLLHALPIFHVHGLFVATNVSLLAGGKMIFLPRFDLETVLEKLPQATTMMGVLVR
jgi:malonyl-CoA/methylmalonyl-CoA synthetase